MSGYTYKWNANREITPTNSYKRNELEKMTMFHLREICRKERLVVSSVQREDKESLIRLIMRFRGQKEYRHIQTRCENGLERIEEYLQCHDVLLTDYMDIRVPGTMTLYSGTQINELDGYQIQSEQGIYEGNLLLIDESFQVYTCFYIQMAEGKAYIFKGKDVAVRPLEKHQYFILYLPKERDSEFLYDCYYGNRTMAPGVLEGVRIPLLDIQEKEIAQAELPLIIDLGSSNTTMGICLPDGSMKTAMVKGSKIIPSLIGVCRQEGEEASFVFGHDAKALGEENYQDEDIAVFYDIKRWISDPNRFEGVTLTDGYKYQFSRREMLRAYLEYLLDLARQQFKCSFTSIQMLAPIRQKEKFQSFFKELLPEYHVNCELDEGMAVLFHSIDRMIAQKSYEGKRWYHALIIDCGGGTTDLTSGRFCIDNNRVSYIVSLETRYENGDTNFGGNNLTYRILQLLKIRIAQVLGCLPDDIFSGSEEPSVRKVDEAYRQAEAYIPTPVSYTHLLTSNLVEAEKITLDQAAAHEERNNLYSFLGERGTPKIQISKKRKLENGDVFLLLTRGVWEQCPDEKLLEIIRDANEPEEVLYRTEDWILERQETAEIDNYTMAVTFVRKVYQSPKKPWTLKKILMVVIPVVLVVGGISIALFLGHRSIQNKEKELAECMEDGETYFQNDNYPVSYTHLCNGIERNTSDGR